MASQVGFPTKCSASSVGTTCTSCPASTSRRATMTALYAAIPPDTPSTMFMASILPSARASRLHTHVYGHHPCSRMRRTCDSDACRARRRSDPSVGCTRALVAGRVSRGDRSPGPPGERSLAGRGFPRRSAGRHSQPRCAVGARRIPRVEGWHRPCLGLGRIAAAASPHRRLQPGRSGGTAGVGHHLGWAAAAPRAA